MMPSQPTTNLLWMASTAIVLASVSFSTAHYIPYDGKNIHLRPQYRAKHGVFENRARHRARDKGKPSMPNHGRVYAEGHSVETSHPHHSDGEELVFSLHTDPEHFFNHDYPDSSTKQNEYLSKDNISAPTTSTYKSWTDAFVMFLIWSLDNLFWMVPFAAHSTTNVAWFAATYQILVLFSCCWRFSSPISLTTARMLNNRWGISGAIFCWILAYCFLLKFMGKHQIFPPSPRHLSEKEEEDHLHADIEMSDLETPLIDPSAQYDHQQSLDATPVIAPGKSLTITMTVVAAMDDIFYVPAMIHNDSPVFTVSDIWKASCLVVLLWSAVALIATLYYRRFLAAIPLYMVVSTYAAAMTGHSLWDWLSSDKTLQILHNTYILHFS